MQKRIIILAAMFTILSVNIKTVVAKERKKRIQAPSVLLVKLPTFTRKIAIYNKAHNDKYAKQCAIDATAMQAEIIKDFKENFKFCQYYFFYDTCSDLILEKKFSGILFNKDLSPVSQEIISPNDTSFQIAYFGNYVSTTGTNESTNKSSDSHNSTYFEATKKQRLVIVDWKFQNLPDPAPNGANLHYGFLSSKSNKTYKSKLFDIYYIRYAGLISADMSSYYRRQ